MQNMQNKLLGEVKFPKKDFSGIDSVFKKFKNKAFSCLTERDRYSEVSQALLTFLQEEAEPCFLLPYVLAFIGRVSKEEILENYTFKHFEFWLNQHSGLTFEENYRIRAKIVGQLVDRSDYQVFFPIGGGKVFEGTHFVTAHRSPDLDTTVASFWGWLDAFGARVGNGLHVWNVPGGPPEQIEIDWLFNELLGPAVFTGLANTYSILHATGQDLMVQKGMLCKRLSESIIGIDHERDQSAVIVVDEEGFYLGEWHSSDVESVRDVILLFSSCLRWFENELQRHLMSFLGQETVRLEDATKTLHQLFDLKFCRSEPALEFTPRQQQKMSKFVVHVLGIRSGLDCTFATLAKELSRLANCSFEDAEELVAQMKGLFGAKGILLEDRAKIFGYLEKTLHTLHATILHIRKCLELLDIAVKTKAEVFGTNNVSIQPHADIEEVRSKMGSQSFLTVVDLDHGEQGKAYPVGVIHAATIHKPILGTVSLRDFCNREEMGIPTYLEVISVIDHHRTTLMTSAPPFAIISDVQSSNTLVAKQAFILSDRYSLMGQTEASIEAEWKKHFSDVGSHLTRLTQNLLQRRMIAHNKTRFFIHPEREFVEYLHLIYAIIDDTDLLTKVTVADIECVVELLNRMKSIASGRICEIISVDDLPRNRSFAKKAAVRILQQEDMYSLYRKVYDLRGVEIERNLALAAKGSPSNIFADTKEQNNCCRIGQTKMFVSNMESFAKFSGPIRAVWQKSAERIARDKPEIALHLHMISTIVDAEQVYRASEAKYTHKDELWMWIPKDTSAQELLQRFLQVFLGSVGLKNHSLEVEIFGERADELSRIFKEVSSSISQKVVKSDGSTISVLRFAPGLLNSRKSMVTPFLPKSS